MSDCPFRSESHVENSNILSGLNSVAVKVLKYLSEDFQGVGAVESVYLHMERRPSLPLHHTLSFLW